MGLSSESKNYTSEVVADYNSMTNDYIRDFKVLRMEAINEIKKDLSFDEMQAWLQGREADFREAIGDDVYDGFAFTYKGGYVHSWNYGDYSDYDPSTRPWYQLAQQANGDVAVVAPYVTFLSNTDYIEQYDSLRLSIAQKYNEEISFDYDLNVKEINDLIVQRKTIYSETVAFLYDANGYILSSTDSNYYGHNIEKSDKQISDKLSKILNGRKNGDYNLSIKNVDGTLRFVYSYTDVEGKTVCLLISFVQVFGRNFLFVLLLALVLVVIEWFFYHRTEVHLTKLEENKVVLNDALRHAEEASHAKGDFMSRMSHEIRTPLNAVIGYLDIAKDEKDNPDKIEHCIEKSQVASRHLLSIINDVLDISSIESGRMKLAHEDFDVKQMINALTTLFYSQAKSKNVNFEVHVEDVSIERVCGDELRVRQVLLNLLSNAVKFTPADGSVILKLRQITDVGQEKKKIRLEFKVSDTGIGMSEEYKNRMFQPFEQESAGTARNFGGTGLGLSICNNLVHMMGGQIEVDSRQGKGTTFTVLMPFDFATTESEEEIVTPDSFSNVYALVVDDESDTCEYTKKLLDRLGVKNDTVTSGKKALRRVGTRLESGKPYNLCIIDWNMKEMDGLETAREVRKICGENVPIIIATGYDYSSIVDEAKAAGVDKIISKPLFQSTLLNLLVNTYGKYTPTKPKETTRVDFKGTKLLLAEDNEMNMEIALDILNKAGFNITPVTNGQEALETFTNAEEGAFDAILMDIQMPIMDGYTATRKIRESNHPQAKTIPIIAMTANAFSEDVTAALAAGMNDHVAKPISYDRLFKVLSHFTNKNTENE